MNRKLFAAAGVAALLAGSAALSQKASADPAIISYQPVPIVAFDRDDRFAGAYDVQGVITYAVPYHLTLRVRGREFPVVLHDGTIIKPTGTTLAPSMVVNIAGYWGRDGAFHANRIVVLRF